jgi:hypothetical protein
MERQNLHNQEQKSPFKRFLFVFGIFMFAFYLVGGLLLIFWDSVPIHLEKPYRVVFGLFLLSYALLRLVRTLQKPRD